MTAPRRAVAALGLLSVALAVVPLALLVHGEWPPLARLDASATQAAERAVTASPALLAAARAVTWLGDPALVWLAALAVAAACAARGAGRLAVFVLVVRAVTQALSTSMKELLDRARPVFEVPVDTALGGAFPSGHTLAAAGFWTALAVVVRPHVRARTRPLPTVAALAVAVLVAASRVLLGVHHATDVVAGLLLGVGTTALVAAALAVPLGARQQVPP